MKLRFEAVFLVFILAFSGCRQDRSVPMPERRNAMRKGDLEILASLNRNGSAYSSQEDVYLNIILKNLADKRIAIPYLLEHPATYVLKNRKTGAQKAIDYTPPAAPGAPLPEPNPEAVAEAGETVAYSLLVQFPLGFISAGEYAIQYKVAFPDLSFATDWMDFSVLPQAVGGYSVTPSSSGPSEHLHLVWSDLAASPGRLVFQRSFIGEQRPLVPRTLVIGEGEDPSTPIASISPPDRDEATAWIGWVSKGSLGLSRITAKDSVKSSVFPLPQKTAWSIVPDLNYSDTPDGKVPRLAGILLGRDDTGTGFSGFVLANSSGPTWLPPFRLPPGSILAAKLIPFTSHRHVLIWARYQEGVLWVEALDWDDTGNLGSEVLACGSFPVSSKAFKSLDASVAGPGISWGLILHDEAPSGKPSALRLIQHSIDVRGFKTGPGIPKTRIFSAHAGPLQAILKFDASGSPWILQRDAHGPWVQSQKWESPIAVDSPRGSKFESLFFRNGSVPKVLLLNQDTGFEAKPVVFPEAE